jgi:peptidoglycan/LPS O-acetylase OafA/YrhL
MAEPTTQSARNVALDNLRVVAMLLGLVTHGVLPFKATGIGRYPIHDCESTVLADACYFAVHDFRMQLFFVVAGFGACALATRRGVGALSRNRVLRIVVPMVLAVLVIAPVMRVLFVAHRVDQTAEKYRSDWGFLSGPEVQLADGEVLELSVVSQLNLPEYLGPGFHLWFLYYLALCCVPLIACFLLAPRLAPAGLVRAGDGLYRGLIGRWWAPALLAAAGAPILWAMRDWWIDTPQGWRLNKLIYLYYLGFFLFGAMLYRHRDRLAVFGRNWAVLLAIANVVVMPAMLKLTITGNRMEDTGPASATLYAWKSAAVLLSGLYTWMMVEGLIGLFQRHFSGSREWWKYLADSSYWCYLAGFPVQVAIQVWLADTPMSIAVKFLLVNVLTFAVLLATYELGVRHTWLGLLLNGKRPERTPVAAPAPVVLAARVRADAAHPEPTGPRWQPQERPADRVEAAAKTRG